MRPRGNRRETISLALHGGAGVAPGVDYTRQVNHLRGLVETGRDLLRGGAAAVDVVVAMVVELERSGLYLAGRGSAPNSAGAFELDASVMDGSTQDAGAVAALNGFRSPVTVARSVMQHCPHLMLVAEGAAAFARTMHLEEIGDPSSWFTPAASAPMIGTQLECGTVGCVALDHLGRLGAATSTGGVLGKLPGRCGDTPIIGAGTWADERVAVSCTGQGEYFIRAAAAAQVAHRVRWLKQSLDEATRATLEQIRALGGTGGLIAVDRIGNVDMPFVSAGMKRAALLPDGSIIASAQAGAPTIPRKRAID